MTIDSFRTLFYRGQTYKPKNTTLAIDNSQVTVEEAVMAMKRLLLVEHAPLLKNSVASILENDVHTTIQSWLGLVEHDDELTCIYLSTHDRICHLPQLFRDVISRLQLPGVTTSLFSIAAWEHGARRRRQGYTAAMMVEESRILEVSIFTTLYNNLLSLSASKMLLDVVTIADECDSQLKQAMLSYAEPESWWAT